MADEQEKEHAQEIIQTMRTNGWASIQAHIVRELQRHMPVALEENDKGREARVRVKSLSELLNMLENIRKDAEGLLSEAEEKSAVGR